MDAPASDLVVVAGPTGSGKSDLALALARRFSGEIVNCDSIQIYRYFDIGAAKTPPSERHGVPHHLIDIANPDEVFTAGDYARHARAALAGITVRGHLPIVVGGTGFYLRALLEGLFEGPSRDEKLRRRLQRIEQRRVGSLHRLLQRRDPSAAGRIHPNDTNKLTRALEVVVKESRPLTEAFAGGRDPLTGYRVFGVGLNPPRADLYRRIDQRLERMFRAGLLDEARGILDRGYPPTCKPFESLGYAQALEVVLHNQAVEQAILDAQMQTRRYAKRQWTWFRKQTQLRWIDGFGDDPTVQEAVGAWVAEFLQS